MALNDFDGASVTGFDDLAPIPLSRRVNHVFGNTPTILTPPPIIDGKSMTGIIMMKVETGTFRMRPGDHRSKTFTLAAGKLNLAGHGLMTGDPIRFSSIATVTGISTATDYWAIAVDPSNISVATSIANANAGTAVVLGGSGSPVMAPLPAVPAATVSDWSGDWSITVSDSIVAFRAPARMTVVGTGASDILSYFYLPSS